MYLKRQYDHSGDEPKVSGVKVLRSHKIEHLSPNFIEQGVAQGWLSMGDGKVVVKGADGDVVFQLVRTPGYYCCHCDKPLDDGPSAQAHLVAAHKDTKSPDPSNPAGYRRDNFYTLVSDTAVENMTPPEALKLEKQVRDALHQKIGKKHRSKIGTGAKIASLGALLILGILVDQLLSSFFAVPGVMLAADFVFNVAKGRVAELYNRVDLSDPANAVIVIVLLATTGLESDAVLKDKDDLAAVVSGATNEATNTGYARKVLSDSDISAFAPDDTNDRVDLDIPDQTWTGLANDGTGAISAFQTYYDSDSTGGADSAIVPMTNHAFVIAPDGSDVTAQIAAAGFFRAS